MWKASATLIASLSVTMALFGGSTAAQRTGAPSTVTYDVVYVRAPRAGDQTLVPIPEVATPVRMPAGSDLMLLHPDGTEEVLVAGGNGAIVDPVVSFDAQWVYYARFHDMRPEALNVQRNHASRAGSDLYKVNLRTRQVVRLTNQEWTPNTGAAEWAKNSLAPGAGPYQLGYGIFNLAPCPLPGGRLMFTSSRNGFLPNKEYTFPNLQLFVMDEDGTNVEEVGFMNLGSALHPVVLSDGRVMFSSYESEGLRDARLWALWSIWPDGRNWGPLMSAFRKEGAFHGHTQLSNGHLAFISYYNMNNNGFGTLLAFPPEAPPGTPAFGRARAEDPSNPKVQEGVRPMGPGVPGTRPVYTNYPFSPYGLYSLTQFTHGRDEAAPRLDGQFLGKVMHPSGAPGNDVLLVWSPGPANHLDRPTRLPMYDAGLYLLPKGTPIDTPTALVSIKNDPAYNELWPKAVVPYREVFGIDEPPDLSRTPSPASPLLPPGAPFGLIGTSTFYRRDTAPGFGPAKFKGLDPFNSAQNDPSSNWVTQGADAGIYRSEDIWAVRILAMEPTSHRSYGPAEGAGFINAANERLRILGEIPLRKTDASGRPMLDVNGDPDTSFLARIPADTPFTFQTLDADGLVLNMSQTWHQLRPGETRHDCGGCHAHSQRPTAFEKTAAARPDYAVPDLARQTPLLTRTADGAPTVVTRPYAPLDVEYYRDIKPILRRSCVQCHSAGGRQEARLALDDESVVNGYENTYNRLARDRNSKYGIPSVLPGKAWRHANVSRYVRPFQSRRSLLTWKVFGRRLDGWTNADFPTESTPGDPSTLPPGASANDADIDFTGEMCPPPGGPVPPLSADEKLLFARWIDLGAPISSPDKAFKGRGWFQDDLRPTLTIASPTRDAGGAPLTEIRIGAFDYYSGLATDSLSVKADFPVNGRPKGSELAPLFRPSADNVWVLPLTPPLSRLERGVLTVSVKDRAGNITRQERTIAIGATGR
ncbi:MAG: hypothetical protein AB7H96_14655 [Vicinamibacterales bacterium]